MNWSTVIGRNFLIIVVTFSAIFRLSYDKSVVRVEGIGVPSVIPLSTTKSLAIFSHSLRGAQTCAVTMS